MTHRTRLVGRPAQRRTCRLATHRPIRGKRPFETSHSRHLRHVQLLHIQVIEVDGTDELVVDVEADLHELGAHARRHDDIELVLRPVERRHLREYERVVIPRADVVVAHVVPRFRKEEGREPDRP